MPSRSVIEGPLVVLNQAATERVISESSTSSDTTGNSLKATLVNSVVVLPVEDSKSQIGHKISPPTTPTKKIKSVVSNNNSNISCPADEKQQPMGLISTTITTATTESGKITNGKLQEQQHQMRNGSSTSDNGKTNNATSSMTSKTSSMAQQLFNYDNNGFYSNHLLIEPYHHSQRSLLNDEDDYSSENEYIDENIIMMKPTTMTNNGYKDHVKLTYESKAKRDEAIRSSIISTPAKTIPIITNPITSRIPITSKTTKLDASSVVARPEIHNGADIIYDHADMPRPKKIYKVVLTGGPCGGKTTGQARLCTFFENLGWKVFRVPEAATVLLSGGIKFSELSEEQAFRFQADLLKTMMHIESVFFSLAESVDKDVLIICDRGTMDASAFIPRGQWEDILNRNGWNEVDIRDTRYNHIIHMVSAANGAEPFYTVEDHSCRDEGIELACKLDQKAAQAWVGHPYFDVVDNSTDFEAKVCRMIQCVCQKLGIDARDRLQTNARKVKYLVKGPLPSDSGFPAGFQDFHVVHDYLQTTVPHPKMQARLRKRGQNGNWSYTYTVRRPELQGQVIEVKTALTQRDYNNMLTQKDHNHVTIYKTRRCFLLNDQYFQLDIYDDPCHPRCKGLILLETYSTLNGIELQQRLPDCLNIVKEVTGDPRYSMFNLSLKDKWENNKNFCQSLAGTNTEDNGRAHSTSESKLAGP